MYKVSSNVKYAAQMSPSWTSQVLWRTIFKRKTLDVSFFQVLKGIGYSLPGDPNPIDFPSKSSARLPNNFFPLHFVKLNLYPWIRLSIWFRDVRKSPFYMYSSFFLSELIERGRMLTLVMTRHQLYKIQAINPI
jgi:hypothetical protein